MYAATRHRLRRCLRAAVAVTTKAPLPLLLVLAATTSVTIVVVSAGGGGEHADALKRLITEAQKKRKDWSAVLSEAEEDAPQAEWLLELRADCHWRYAALADDFDADNAADVAIEKAAAEMWPALREFYADWLNAAADANAAFSETSRRAYEAFGTPATTALSDAEMRLTLEFVEQYIGTREKTLLKKRLRAEALKAVGGGGGDDDAKLANAPSITPTEWLEKLKPSLDVQSDESVDDALDDFNVLTPMGRRLRARYGPGFAHTTLTRFARGKFFGEQTRLLGILLYAFPPLDEEDNNVKLSDLLDAKSNKKIGEKTQKLWEYVTSNKKLKKAIDNLLPITLGEFKEKIQALKEAFKAAKLKRKDVAEHLNTKYKFTEGNVARLYAIDLRLRL